MEISDIYVHDGRLHRVIEDLAAGTVTMEVELPVLKRAEALEPRLLVFEDAYNYKVFESPMEDRVTILDMNVVGKQGPWHQVRIETNGGYREIFCRGVKVLAHDGVRYPKL
jgi:hypothetical protein